MKAKFHTDLRRTQNKFPRSDDPTPVTLRENLISADVLVHTQMKNSDWFNENDNNSGPINK